MPDFHRYQKKEKSLYRTSMMLPQVQRVVPFLLHHKEILILFFLTCVFFFPIIIHPDQMIYPPGNVAGNDVTAQYSFWRSFFASTISHGEGVPLWNPYVFSGTPFIGNPLSAMFYPFTWLFVIFNPDLLFGGLFFIDVFIIGVFTFLFARTINLSRPAALFSAVVFMFCGTTILRIYAGHLSNLDAITWFPLVLLFYERSFFHNRLASGVGAGVALGLMFLSGNLQFALYGSCAALIYLIGRALIADTLPGTKEKCRHALIVLLVSIGICFVISAVQLLPSWEYSQLSNRAGGTSFDFSSQYSLPPSNLVTLIVPDALGTPLGTPLGPIPPPSPFPMVSYWELCCYLGILPLFLIILGILFGRTRWTVLFLGIAAIALLFSMGKFFPLYGLVYQYIPGFSSLRIPASMLFVFTFSFAVLAGLGFDAVVGDPASGKKKFAEFASRPGVHRAGICITLSGSLLLIISYLCGLLVPPYVQPAVFVWLAFTALFWIGPLLLTKNELKTRGRDLFLILLMGILIADIFLFGIGFIETKPTSDIYVNPGFIPVIKNETNSYFRIYDETGLLGQNIAYRNNLYLINGYDPTYLKEYQSFFIQSQSVNYSGHSEWMQGAVIGNFDILRQLNVRYIITRRNYEDNEGIPGRGVSGLQLVYDNDSVLVYRLNFTYPRAYLIPLSEFGNTTPVSFKPAEIEQYSPNTITVKATTDTPEYLILSEIYYPGWTALDNSQPVEIIRYQNVFRAVYLAPGIHQVTFTYFPKILTF